jgi:hypothetical protein
MRKLLTTSLFQGVAAVALSLNAFAQEEVDKTPERLTECFAALEQQTPKEYEVSVRVQSNPEKWGTGEYGVGKRVESNGYSCSVRVALNNLDDVPHPSYYVTFNDRLNGEFASVTMPICGDGKPGASTVRNYSLDRDDTFITTIFEDVAVIQTAAQDVAVPVWDFAMTQQGERAESLLSALEKEAKTPGTIQMAQQSYIGRMVSPSACLVY